MGILKMWMVKGLMFKMNYDKLKLGLIKIVCNFYIINDVVN